MPSLLFSQQHQHPLPPHYQGNDALELACQCFVDWQEAHGYGELDEFLAQIQAINHAAHWLQADIIAHNELRNSFRALNRTILSKHKALETCQQFGPQQRYVLGLAADPANDAIIRVHEAQISKLRACITATKGTMRSIKEERYRAPMVEMAYRVLISGHDLLMPNTANNNTTALHPIIWAVEQITYLVYLALEAETETYLANMCRLSRELASKLTALVAKEEEKKHAGKELLCNDYIERLQHEQALLKRLIEGRGADAVDSPSEGQTERGNEYLGQIVRFWSQWDLDGYAEREFWMIWSFVSKRKCVVWHR